MIGGSDIFEQCLQRYPDLLNYVYITRFYSDYTNRTEKSKIFPHEYLMYHPTIRTSSKESMGHVYNQEKDIYIETPLKYRFDVYQSSIYENKEEFFEVNKHKKMAFLCSHGAKDHWDIDYTDDMFLVFGKESTGLSKDILAANTDQLFKDCIIKYLNKWFKIMQLHDLAKILYYYLVFTTDQAVVV